MSDVVCIYARQDISKKNSIKIEDQIKLCKQRIDEINSEKEVLGYITYEDRHYGDCGRLLGFESMLKDAKSNVFKAIYYCGKRILIGERMERIGFMQDIINQGIMLYDADKDDLLIGSIDEEII